MRRILLVVIVLAGAVLSACSNPFDTTTILDIVKKHYQVSDTVKSSVDHEDTAMIFLGKNKSVSQVASELKKDKKPNKTSNEVKGKEVLVYDDYFVTLTKNKDNPKNTNIEVATYGFVRDNYRPSFFDGLLTYYFLSQLFHAPNWASQQGQRCYTTSGCYRGYNHSGGHYKGPGSKPLFRTSIFRGGGPNAGK